MTFTTTTNYRISFKKISHYSIIPSSCPFILISLHNGLSFFKCRLQFTPVLWELHTITTHSFWNNSLPETKANKTKFWRYLQSETGGTGTNKVLRVELPNTNLYDLTTCIYMINQVVSLLSNQKTVLFL